MNKYVSLAIGFYFGFIVCNLINLIVDFSLTSLISFTFINLIIFLMMLVLREAENDN